MSQADLNIADQSRSTFRAEVNQSLQALASLSSGATGPTTTYAYQLWADTTSGLLKQRSAANDAWINKGNLADVNWGFLAAAGGTMTGDLVMSGASVIETEGADVASATTTDIWATDGNTRHVTGNVTIASFGTAPQVGARMKLIFDGTPQLTQSANLNLNAGGSNIIIEAGDWAEVYADTTTQFDVVVHRKSGAAVVGGVTNSVSRLNSSVTVTDAGTGKIETTVDGTIIEELTLASRKSTIDGGSTLYPEFKCRAWVNFNGTGTPATRASGNVTSITDNGAGDYTINFTTAMPDANYAISGSVVESGGFIRTVCFSSLTAPATGSCRISVSDASATRKDEAYVSVSFFR